MRDALDEPVCDATLARVHLVFLAVKLALFGHWMYVVGILFDFGVSKMTSWLATHACGRLDEKNIGQTVQIVGWVGRRRDHGGVIFIDCRDGAGYVQVVCHPEHAHVFAQAEQLRSEFVIAVTGEVAQRPEGTINKDLATGAIEIHATTLTCLNTALPLPFAISDDVQANEDVRLLHRYLDLRRPEMQYRMRLRAQVVREMRRYLESHDFLDIETPVLTKATPEGARDYIVPSRTHQGSFFALPQSPQIFKQLLMMSGFERYYQVVKCFRDEDLRADRQPEFTQLDMEMAFVDEKQVMTMMEGLVRHLFKTVLSVDLPDPLPVLDYRTCMARYGNDRPDLRNPLRFVSLDDHCVDQDFAVFAKPAQHPLGRVVGLKVPGGATLSRREIDHYTDLVVKLGAKGLAYIKVNDLSQGVAGLQSPIVKFLTPEAVMAMVEATEAVDGDLIFFGAGPQAMVNQTMSALRDRLGQDLSLIDPAAWALLWVVDFPMFEVDYHDDGRVKALMPQHHPFTAPCASLDVFQQSPEKALSKAYDMVLNGCEIGGGSIRIHDIQMQKAVFDMLGIEDDVAEQEFGHLLRGLQYGCPPHGGLAFGVDRLVMLMTQAQSIRDVIAFPKTQSAACPLTAAPAPVQPAQLQDLAIRVKALVKETVKDNE